MTARTNNTDWSGKALTSPGYRTYVYGRSDGSFYAHTHQDGEELLEDDIKDSAWVPDGFDLAAFEASTLKLYIESHERAQREWREGYRCACGCGCRQRHWSPTSSYCGDCAVGDCPDVDLVFARQL